MTAKKDTPASLARKRNLLSDTIAGRTETSSTQLSASFGLPVEDVRRILKQRGVQDNG